MCADWVALSKAEIFPSVQQCANVFVRGHHLGHGDGSVNPLLQADEQDPCDALVSPVLTLLLC